jgi:hypothetical protein
MWAIRNDTRYKAGRTFTRGRDGAEIWLVAVRATFQFTTTGEVVLAEEQQDVCLAPKWFGEPAKSSLRYDTDLVRTKSGTDILLHASAYAPGGRPATSVDVEWRVGPLSKKLRVVGDREWGGAMLGLSPSQPASFTTMPIRYEKAFGGRLSDAPDAPHDPANKVGVGRTGAAGDPLPNCEFPGQPVRSPKASLPVAGFGPIPYDWQPRAKLAGTYDEAWRKERQPLVPTDFNDSYFRCAPADQQVDGFLRGGETVVLKNLTPEGQTTFTLPRISFGFHTNIDDRTILHHGQLHTVIIEPDERLLIMVWQTSLPCHRTLYTLKRTIVSEKHRVPLGPVLSGSSRPD